jgi:hypothetical protein
MSARKKKARHSEKFLSHAMDCDGKIHQNLLKDHLKIRI